MQLIEPDDIDFDFYLRASDSGQKIRQASVWLQEIEQDYTSPEPVPQDFMPWSKTQGLFAFRPGEVTVYAGSNGGGKSLITGQIALSLMRQKRRICIASFEMKPKRTILRMLRQFAAENIDFPRYQGKAEYIAGLLERFAFFSKDHLWLYDQQGSTSADQVISMARYCAVELKITHIFIDSLMKCVAGEDDYNGQKDFVDRLTALARDHNVHIHLVHHIRKLNNEEMTPNKNDIKGTGAIADQVDNVLLMWRNKKKEHQAQTGGAVDVMTPDAMLMCEKQRNGESEDWFSLWYHRDSQQFVEGHDSVPMAFDAGGRF